MKRIKLFMILFFICLSIPLGYFIVRTHQSLEQEERAELRFFADTLFYEMEKELSELVLREEGREIEDYTSFSELSVLPKEKYLLGYFQNNPDGSFQTPLAAESADSSDFSKGHSEVDQIAAVVNHLEDVNRIFNTRRTILSEPAELPLPEKVLPEKEEPFSLAGRYLDLSRSRQKKEFLGQEEKRVQNITADQAIQLSKQSKKSAESFSAQDRWMADSSVPPKVAAERDAPGLSSSLTGGHEEGNGVSLEIVDELTVPAPAGLGENGNSRATGKDLNTSMFRAEVDPMQSVFVSDDQVIFFRRIVIDNQVYRQGFVLLVGQFLDHMAGSHFTSQPMSDFARLELSVQNSGKNRTLIETGVLSGNPEFSLSHRFPRPFSFLSARLVSDDIPRSAGRQTLNIMLVIMVLVIVPGLVAIYRSVNAIVGFSERRSQFVSSVTHELKTPLTNIRMYIEMLEQGIATSADREQDYFRILDSESSRLSRLINNVLEYSRLEKKNRRLEISEGTLDDVITRIKSIMSEKIRQEGFEFQVENKTEAACLYDREVMIQVLMNLIENSMKFSKNSLQKKMILSVEPLNGEVRISLSDTGPGIPKHALKKVFDDFFRVDNELTRTTGGTGIGLALVSRFIREMGGRVEAKNNTGPGCTISIFLPVQKV